MTQAQYLSDLSAQLAHLPHDEREDILEQVREHFAQALEAGRTEQDIIDALGPVKTMAAQYESGASAPPPPSPTPPPPPLPPVYANHAQVSGAGAPPPPPPPRREANIGLAILLWVVNLTICYPILLSLFCAYISLMIAGAAIIISFVAAFVFEMWAVFFGTPLLPGALGVLATILLFICGLAGGQLFIGLVDLAVKPLWRYALRPYLRWSGRVMTGGSV